MENALSAPEKKQLVESEGLEEQDRVDKHSYSIEGDRAWQYSSNALTKPFYMLGLKTIGLMFQKYVDFICNECFMK